MGKRKQATKKSIDWKDVVVGTVVDLVVGVILLLIAKLLG